MKCYKCGKEYPREELWGAGICENCLYKETNKREYIIQVKLEFPLTIKNTEKEDLEIKGKVQEYFASLLKDELIEIKEIEKIFVK